MNILVPDHWLRQFLKTKATPAQIKEFVSLSGPLIERIHEVKGESIYDVEVTTNRPDSMSIVGVAREIAAILPQHEIPATLMQDPYSLNVQKFVNIIDKGNDKSITVVIDPELCPRFMSLAITNLTIKPSPDWLQRSLLGAGIRPINNVVDITNYVMKAFGQPAHAFDLSRIKPKNGTPYLKLRAAKRKEKVTTLDDKTYSLPGGDIVIEDGSGDLIDLCGIMGGKSSAISDKTQTILLTMQTYNPTHIRKTSMTLSARSEASALFEKGLDSELVLPVFIKAVELVLELTGGTVTPTLVDFYPKPFQKHEVEVSRNHLNDYLGFSLSSEKIKTLLASLGMEASVSKSSVMLSVPSFRRDITEGVDIIEEVARMYGYYQIAPTLPAQPPPLVVEKTSLTQEMEIKIRLRDWGYTETYAYSMISKKLLEFCANPTPVAPEIANPLSTEWVYLRPSLIPSMLQTVAQNIPHRPDLSLFELSHVYDYSAKDLPRERSQLVVCKTGDSFFQLKGIAAALFQLYGIPFPTESLPATYPFDAEKSMRLGDFGSLGYIDSSVTRAFGVSAALVVVQIDLGALFANAVAHKVYTPIGKYSPIIEDISFTFPPKTPAGSVSDFIKSLSPLISQVTLLSQFEDALTYRIHYQSQEKQLAATDTLPLRQEIITAIRNRFSGLLKGTS